MTIDCTTTNAVRTAIGTASLIVEQEGESPDEAEQETGELGEAGGEEEATVDVEQEDAPLADAEPDDAEPEYADIDDAELVDMDSDDEEPIDEEPDDAEPVATQPTEARRGGPLRILARTLLGRRLSAFASADAGMSTVEYAVGTIAAAAFGAVLYTVVSGDSIPDALGGIIEQALNTSV